MAALKIVAATDFSLRSQRALQRAGLIARQFSAELTLVHVVDDDQPEPLVTLECREANKFMSEQISSLGELHDVRCHALVMTGGAFDRILIAAANLPADLIVMGSHRKQLLREVFVGTTIERVVRSGPVPVLMVNTAATNRYHYIVCGVDMSEASANAIRKAKTLGFLEDANVTLVHAFEVSANGRLHLAGAAQEQMAAYISRERLQARAELLDFLSARKLLGAGWSHRLEEGAPFQVIGQIVTELTPDLLVIGTHGRSGLARLLLGSVAEEILRSLEVDILAVPPS